MELKPQESSPSPSLSASQDQSPHTPSELGKSFFSTTEDDSVHREQVTRQFILTSQSTMDMLSNSLPPAPASPSPSFERFTYCRMKIVKGDSKEKATQMRKSYWLHPVPKIVTAAEKEEADLLTTFSFYPGGPQIPKTNIGITVPLIFIPEFFAQFKPENLRMFSFVLSKNQRQDEYQNIYNPNGLRYFFGCEFTDFEQLKQESGTLKKNLAQLDLNQSVMLFESRFPFRTFFEVLLVQLFQSVRVRRLEQYAEHFNGDESDRSNLINIKYLDSTTQAAVCSPYLGHEYGMHAHFNTIQKTEFSTCFHSALSTAFDRYILQS